MSNRYSHYVWECLSQKVLDEFCEKDEIKKTARHKWIHLSQAIKLLKYTPKQLYREGFRDFLVVRTNPFYYGWDNTHLDGIIHPEALLIHAGRVATERSRAMVVRELSKTGLPSVVEMSLLSAIYDGPERFHKMVRLASREGPPIGRVKMDSAHLPKESYNGYELRLQRTWWEETEQSAHPSEIVRPGGVQDVQASMAESGNDSEEMEKKKA